MPAVKKTNPTVRDKTEKQFEAVHIKSNYAYIFSNPSTLSKTVTLYHALHPEAPFIKNLIIFKVRKFK
jgi:hypothetical protein